ncbi:MAG TPA: hypothetical protein VEH04_16745 [Verrucomicrobiae bacterium]|nr:hypothetical protein [Verrucomicrobiae bacterium]
MAFEIPVEDREPTATNSPFQVPETDKDASFQAPPEDRQLDEDLQFFNSASVDGLATNYKFEPHDFYNQHKSYLKPEQVEKLANIASARRTKGVTAGAVVEGVSRLPETVGHFIESGAKAASELNLQAALNDYSKETGKGKSALEAALAVGKKKLGEALGGVETMATGFAGLARSGIRTLVNDEVERGILNKVGVSEAVADKVLGKRVQADIMDPGSFALPEDNLKRFFDDAAAREQVGKTAQGQGVYGELTGLDAETLAKEGIELDPKVIGGAAILSDPTLWVPFLAGLRAVKAANGGMQLVNAAGKTIGTAATEGAAERFIRSTAGLMQKGADKGRDLVQKTPLVHAAAVPATVLSVVTGNPGPSILASLGTKLAARGAVGATDFAAKVLGSDAVVKGLGATARGAAHGTAWSMPFAAATDDPAEAVTMAGIGTALGAAGGAASQTVASGVARARQLLNSAYYRAGSLKTVQDVPLNVPGMEAFEAEHSRMLSDLNQRDKDTAGIVNRMRAALSSGSDKPTMEAYLVSPEFAEKANPGMANKDGAFEVTVADANGAAKKVLLWVADPAVTHEGSHFITKYVMSEADRNQILNAVGKDFQKEFADAYLGREGLTDQQRAAADPNMELVTELVSAHLEGTRLDGLSLSGRDKIVRSIAGALDRLGFFRTEFSPTAEAGQPVSTVMGVKSSPRVSNIIDDVVQGWLADPEVSAAMNEIAKPPVAGQPKATPTPVAKQAATPPPIPQEAVNQIPVQPAAPKQPIEVPVQKAQEPPRIIETLTDDFDATPEATAQVRKAREESGIVELFPLPEEAVKPAEAPAVPAPSPEAAPAAEAPNLRGVARQDYKPFEGPRRSRDEIGLTETASAVEADAALTPEQKQAFATLSENTRRPVQLLYRSAETDGNMNRTARREQIEEGRDGGPRIEEGVGKTAIPFAFRVTKEGVQQVNVFSPDKLLANAKEVVARAGKKGKGDLLPYENAEGSLTAKGEAEFNRDIEDYLANQDNGYLGNGEKVVRPENYSGFIPAENPDYTPVKISKERMQFLNLVQGIAPPKSAREMTVAGVTKYPTNLRAQDLNKAQTHPNEITEPKLFPNKKGEFPIQRYKSFDDRPIVEMNPLRKKLDNEGVNTRELTETTEWINVRDILKAEPMQQNRLALPADDLVNAGFMPSEVRGAPKASEFQNAKQIERALKKKGWSVLTATQEALGDATAKPNVEANAQLAAMLKQQGFDFVEVKGFYKGVDQGKNFLVTNISPKTALEISKHFKQESVLVPEGLLYQDSTLNPVDHSGTIVGDVAKTQDFYSQVDNGPAFTLGLDFEKKVQWTDEEPVAQFMAGKRGPKAPKTGTEPARDAEGRPLKANGLIDYERWAAEEQAARDAYVPQIDTTPKAPKAKSEAKGNPTAWILPDGETQPLADAYHENALAKNADAFNSKFGTAFEATPDQAARLDAIKAGFVRIRYTPNDGNFRAELGSKYWRTQGKKLLEHALAHQSKIDRLTVNVLDESGREIVSDSTSIFASKDKEQAIRDFFNEIELPSMDADVPAGRGPTLIQRARALPDAPDAPAPGALDQADFMPSSNKEKGPVWFSQLERVVGSKMANSTTPEQLQAMLKNPQNGVKGEELKWSGLDDFLSGKTKVTKQEVLDFLEQNRLEVKEVVKGGAQELSPALQGWLERNSVDRPNSSEAWVDVAARLEREAQRWQENGDDWQAQRRFEMAEEATRRSEFDNDGAPTKFSRYQLPGGENYREMLFTMPPAKELQGNFTLPEGHVVRKTDPSRPYAWEHVDADGKRVGPEFGARSLAEAQRFAADRLHGGGRPNQQHADKVFRSSHWDEPNVLAHTRVNDRVDADSRPGLFVEEIQSDWHQKGRKEGYRQRKEVTPLEEVRVGEVGYADGHRFKFLDLKVGDYLFFKTKEEALQAQREWAADNMTTAGVPDAPFKNTWHEFVFRRLVRQAAEEGKEWIGWTTGEMQAERYDLSKQVEKVSAWRMDDQRDLYSMHIELKDGTFQQFDDQPASRLPDLIGKELADKIVSDPQVANDGVHLSGLDLKVGGEGMKGFYDKMLVDFANKFGKKFGAKVEMRDVPAASIHEGQEMAYSLREVEEDRWQWFNDDEEAVGPEFRSEDEAHAWKEADLYPVHSLPITEAMRNSVLEGQPMFMPTKGNVKVRANAESVTLSEDVLPAFLPVNKVDLRDYVDRPVMVLTADRLGVGVKEVGPTGAKKPVSVDAQGGRGFSYIAADGGWAFSDQQSASRFLSRVKDVAGDNDSALVAVSVLSPLNHLKSRYGQLAYHDALQAAVEAGAVSQKLADRQIREIFNRVKASDTVPKEKKVIARNIKSLADFKRAIDEGAIDFGLAATYLKRAVQKELPIHANEAKEIGIAPDQVAADIADPELVDVDFGTVVALLEIPVAQRPQKTDFHFSYPFQVAGRPIGFLKKFKNVSELSGESRIRNSRGEVTAQPLQTVMPILDRLRSAEVLEQWMPSRKAAAEELPIRKRGTTPANLDIRSRAKGVPVSTMSLEE